jgi:hypothetical protein
LQCKFKCNFLSVSWSCPRIVDLMGILVVAADTSDRINR